MPLRSGTLLLLRDLGAGWSIQKIHDLADKLQLRLNQPVVLGSLEQHLFPLTTAISELVKADVNQLVVVPFGLLPVPRFGQFQHTVAWAKQQWPALLFQFAAPLTWIEWSQWLRSLAMETAQQHGIAVEDASLVIVGRESTQPMSNANVARMAHLIRESSSFSDVNYAFPGTVRPDLQDVFTKLAKTNAQKVLILPWLISEAGELKQLHQEIELVTKDLPFEIYDIETDPAHTSMVNVLLANHCAALTETEFRASTASEMNSQGGETTQSAITPEDVYELQQLEQRINFMLPSQYQGNYEEVAPQSMGTASLKYDDEGRVAWDQIWTSFCDLAIAGGPPHRGKLLEAVTTEEALADFEKYQAVVHEIGRGIHLVTALPIVESRTPGWVGVRCQNEEMAVWLMRAIIVENIMVRREGSTLYLPAGPHFRVQKEIKNVITAVAKTVHYWSAHLLAKREANLQDSNP